MRNSMLIFARKFIPLASLLLLGLLYNCGGAGENEAAHTATRPESDNSDSLRQAYQQFLAARTDTMPVDAIVEPGKLYPEDQALRDTAFFVFRERLREAVRQKDILQVMQTVDDQIKVSFGGGDGRDGFIQHWKLTSEEDAKNSELWQVLEEVLSGGGAFEEQGSRFVAPYVYANWPEPVDAFTYGAITGAGVRVRQAPNANSRILSMVSHDIVPWLGQDEKIETIDGQSFPWVRIKTPDGEEGFVWGKFIRSPIAYRTGFERRDNQWKMVFLVSGD